MGNRRRGSYDPGATFGPYSEAEIVMDWVNTVRTLLLADGHKVVRTRVDAKDPCPVSRRDDIARAYGCERMISFHCNAFNGSAHGVEVIYRGADDKAFAERLSACVATTMGVTNRGAKTEKDSQHPTLAVMEFDKCWLIELGFIDHAGDRAKLLDPTVRDRVCLELAKIIVS